MDEFLNTVIKKFEEETKQNLKEIDFANKINKLMGSEPAENINIDITPQIDAIINNLVDLFFNGEMRDILSKSFEQLSENELNKFLNFINNELDKIQKQEQYKADLLLLFNLVKLILLTFIDYETKENKSKFNESDIIGMALIKSLLSNPKKFSNIISYINKNVSNFINININNVDKQELKSIEAFTDYFINKVLLNPSSDYQNEMFSLFFVLEHLAPNVEINFIPTLENLSVDDKFGLEEFVYI